MDKMPPISGNEAAWLDSPGAYPLRVGPGPQPDPADNEVVIKVAYGAVNPLDWKVGFTFLPFCAGTEHIILASRSSASSAHTQYSGCRRFWDSRTVRTQSNPIPSGTESVWV